MKFPWEHGFITELWCQLSGFAPNKPRKSERFPELMHALLSSRPVAGQTSVIALSRAFLRRMPSNVNFQEYHENIELKMQCNLGKWTKQHLYDDAIMIFFNWGFNVAKKKKGLFFRSGESCPFLLFCSVNTNAMNQTKGPMHFRWLSCTVKRSCGLFGINSTLKETT